MARPWFRKLSVLAGAAIFAVTGAAVVAQASPTTLNWGPVSTSQNPPGREFAAMAFDSARNRTVLFGGGSGALTNLSDTWEFDGAGWVQRTPSTSPPALVGPAMAFDANRHVSVLFGGATPSGDSAATWEWDGANWTLRTFATAPTARLWTTMAYDSTRGRIVLFGGDGPGSTEFGDTWEYDGLTWTHMAPANSPSPRFGAAMAYDPGLGRVVLFGGRVSGQRMADTWEWDGNNWTQFSPTATPFSRFWHTMAYDPQVGHVVVFGGDHIEPFGLGPINDTWEWDGSQWTQDWTNATPSWRAGQTMALDANGRIVMFGGSDEGNPGVFPTDTEELGTGIVTSAGNPSITLPASVDFGNVDVGVTSSGGYIQLFNTGTGPLVAAISTTGDFAISSTYCPSSPNPLAAGMLCRAFISFTPTAAGDRSGSFVVTGNVPGGSQTVALHGFGVCCDFTISASPTNTGAVQGSSLTTSISTTVVGTPGTVALSFTSTDPGLTATFSPSSITAGGGSTMTITVGPAVPVGLQALDAVGTEGPLFHRVEVFVNVRAPATNDFSLTANPSNPTVFQGGSGTSTINTALVTGTAGVVNLTATAPAGLTAILNPTSVTVGGSSTVTVTASAAVTPGSYAVLVNGVEGSVLHQTQLTVKVTPPPPDFAISASPSSVSVAQGQNATTAINTALVAGTADSINLTTTSSTALTATLNPSVVNAGGASTLTISAGPLATPGTYAVTVTGTDGSAMHSTSVTVSVTAAASDFSIATNPNSLAVVQGTGASSGISTALVTGTADAITLSATPPPGLTAVLNPSSVTAGSGSTLTVTASAAVTPGTYTVTVTGVEGSSTHSLSVTVNVSAAPSDFAISTNPNSLDIVQGGEGTSSISTLLVTGTADAIGLSVSSSPVGLTSALSPATVNAGGASTLTVSVDALATPGIYTVTVTGAEGSATHSASVTVNVTSASSDFSITANPSSLTVMQGNTGTSTIGTAMITGTADAITLSTSSAPGGLTATLNPAVVNAGGASTLTVSPGFATPPGVYSVTVTGTEASGATHSTSLTVTVTPAPTNFAISANPSALSIAQGSSATSSIGTVQVEAPGTVALSASASPAGLTVALSPASISAGGTSILTVSAAYRTAPGTYTVTVTGTEGPNTHSTLIAVTVTIKAIVNGGFETGDFTGWTTTGTTAIVSTSHSGAFAARVGSTSPSADSTVSQTFTVPTAGSRLSFWYRMSCSDKVKNDWFKVTLRDGVTGATATLQPAVCSNTPTWTRVTANLRMFAGHSVTVTFVNHDDGHAGNPTYTLLDDVALI